MIVLRTFFAVWLKLVCRKKKVKRKKSRAGEIFFIIGWD